MASCLHQEVDYYNVLNIPRSATQGEITIAYRKLAVRLCPFRPKEHARDFVPGADDFQETHLSPIPEERQWEMINMAYDVLGNELHRSIYDRFGEGGLCTGVILPNGHFPPYMYHGDHKKVYFSVFGSYSPYANIIDAVSTPPVLHSNEMGGMGVRMKDKPVERIVYLELEEVNEGCMKLMHVWRDEFVDAKELAVEKRMITLEVNIPPGTTENTRFLFKECGDRIPSKIPADVIFVTADKPHKKFLRTNDHDLLVKQNISLVKALTGFRFTIETLDHRLLTVLINEVVYPGYKKVMPGEGLPKCSLEDASTVLQTSITPREKGDLIVEFNVIFPKKLTEEMKTKTRDFFAELEVLEFEAKQNETQNDTQNKPASPPSDNPSSEPTNEMP